MVGSPFAVPLFKAGEKRARRCRDRGAAARQLAPPRTKGRRRLDGYLESHVAKIKHRV